MASSERATSNISSEESHFEQRLQLICDHFNSRITSSVEERPFHTERSKKIKQIKVKCGKHLA